MSEAYEKLGISIDLKINDSLKQAIKNIQDSFNNIKLNGLDTAISGTAKALQSSFGYTKKQLEDIGKQFNLTGAQAKEFLKAATDETQLQKGVKSLNDYAKNASNAFRKVQEEHGQSMIAALKNTKAFNDAAIKSYEDKGKQILAIEKRTQADIRAQLDAHIGALKLNAQYDKLLPKIKMYEDYMQSLRTRGQAIWNGQVVSIQEYNRNLRLANGEHDRFSLSLSNIAKRMSEFYGIRAVMFAVTDQIREAVAGALDLNQAMHDIAAISGTSRESMHEYSKAIMDIATNSRFSAKEVASLMQVLAQAGVKMADLPGLSKTVGMFATATGSDPKVSADLVTTGMNVFAIEADNVARITNAMTAALNESKLSTEGLATAFNYLAPQAAQLGMTVEQTLGMIATQAQAGIKPSTIGTGLSQLMKDLSAPKPRLRKLFEVYGIDPESVNMAKHTLDEVADVFKAAKVEVIDLMQAMDTRVGRAAVTAMTLGGDAFREMTANVSGTNAMIQANSIVMEGARARVNVLKQEFQSFAVTVGNAVGPALAAIVDVLTAIVRGMNTGAGQVTVLAAALGPLVLSVNAIIASLARLAAVVMLNPLFWPAAGVAAAVAAIAGALYYFGTASSDAAKKAEDFNKAQLKQAEQQQKAIKVLNKASLEMDSHNKQLKEYNKLTDEEKQKQHSKYAAVLGEKAVLTESTRKALVDLKQEYPQHFKNLDIENASNLTLLETLREVNRERKVAEINKINQYNTNAAAIAKNNAQIKETEQQRERGEGNVFNYLKRKNLQEDNEKLKKLNQDTYTSLTGAVRFTKVGDQLHILDDKGIAPDRDGTSRMPKGGKSGESKAETAEEKKARLDKASKDDILEARIRIQKLNIEIAKEEAEAAKLKMKEDRDLEDYKTKAHLALKEEYAAKNVEAILEVNRKAANDLKGEFTYSTNADGSFKEGLQVVAGEDVLQPQLDARMVVARAELRARQVALANAQINEEAKIDQTKLPKPETHSTYNSSKLEKDEKYRMQLVSKRIALEQEEQWTVEGARSKSIELLDEEVASNRKIATFYKDHIIDLGKTTELKEKNKDQITELEAKERDILDLVKEQVRERDKLAKETSLSRFTDGVRGAYKSQTDTGAMSDQLGAGMTNTFFDGMNTSINGMIDALARGQNAWVSFRNSLRNMVKDIVDELQKYIVKMLVVYSVRKLIGWAANTDSGAGGLISGGEWGSNVPGSSSFVGPIAPGATGGLVRLGGIGTNPVMRLAGGGFIPNNMGVPGQDSVPALLMPGEFVIKKSVVDRYSPEYFRKLNAQKFAEGGLVGGRPSPLGSSGQENSLTIINVVDPNSIPRGLSKNEVINVINYDIAARGPTYKTFKGIMQGN